MLPINRRFAALTFVTATLLGCSSIIGSLPSANSNTYGPLVNQAIPVNGLHVYQLPLPTSNIGRTTSMAIRADNARVEKLSDAFALAGVALAFLPSMGSSGLPLFLVCSASLTGNQTVDWWRKTSLQPASLMSGVADRKYCFTENGRVHVR